MSRTPNALVSAVIPLLLVIACSSEPQTATEELRGKVLFYEWPHGGTLTDQPDRVAAIRAEKVRSLQELEDFSGTLEEWRRRTGPVERIRVGADEFVIDERIFFYFVTSLQEPAASPRLIARIMVQGPDGNEILGHEERRSARMNKHVQMGGLLFSMQGLEFGEQLLRLEMLDGESVVAQSVLVVDFHPGEQNAPAGTSGETPTSR